jgi:hypothetical protein
MTLTVVERLIAVYYFAALSNPYPFSFANSRWLVQFVDPISNPPSWDPTRSFTYLNYEKEAGFHFSIPIIFHMSFFIFPA